MRVRAHGLAEKLCELGNESEDLVLSIHLLRSLVEKNPTLKFVGTPLAATAAWMRRWQQSARLRGGCVLDATNRLDAEMSALLAPDGPVGSMVAFPLCAPYLVS